jgi:uncharacterized damage-inducible protein DinB
LLRQTTGVRRKRYAAAAFSENQERTLMNAVESFIAVWDREAQKTVDLLKMLPSGQYDFRPDAGGRSLGELAWHLAELDAYVSYGIANGAFAEDVKPPNIKRPMTIEELAPGYKRVHEEARERVRNLKPIDLEKEMQFFGSTQTVSALLWGVMLLHSIHHRGQLSLMVRLSGGVVPELFGPTRERSQSAAKN